MNEWLAKCRLVFYSNTYIPGSFDRNAIQWGPCADFDQLSFVRKSNMYPTVPPVDVEIDDNYFGAPGAFDGIKFLFLLRTDGGYNTPFSTPLNQTFVHSLISFHAQLQNVHISLLRNHQFCFPTLEDYMTFNVLGNLQEILQDHIKEEFLGCFIQILIASSMSVFIAFRQNLLLQNNYQLVRYRFVSPQLSWTEAGEEQEIDFYTDFFPFNENDPYNFEPLFHYLDLHQEEYNFPNVYQVFDHFVIMNVETYMEPRDQPIVPVQAASIAVPNFQSIIRTRSQVRQELPVSAFTRARSAAAGYRIGWVINKQNSMFFQDPLHFFFQESQCMLKVPESPEAYCFAMAFLKAQRRVHLLNEEGDIDDIIEINGNKSCKVYGREKYIHVIECKDLDYNRRKGEFYDGHFIYFGNTYHIPNRNEDDIHIWQQAGKKIHEYVQTQLGMEIDQRDLLACAHSYAQVFETYIHIYKYEYRSTRLFMFPPEREFENTVHHVHLFLEDEHVHAITNIRKFMVNPKTKANVSLHHFCDYCTRCVSDGEIKSRGCEHLTRCYRNPDKFHDFYVKKAMKISLKRPYRFDFKTKGYICTHCYQPLTRVEIEKHTCFIQCPRVKPCIDNAHLWVFDIEVRQEKEDGLYRHIPILICLQHMYQDEKYEFKTAEEFCVFVFTKPQFENAVFLTHNGGSYDYMFLMIYIEKHGLTHTVLNRGMSKTKMLSMTVQTDAGTRYFLDFCCMVPGSLRNIAEAFQVSSGKSRFPYLWPDIHYRGPIPPYDSIEDWFGMRQCRSNAEIQEVMEWYDEQCVDICSCRTDQCMCGKKPWDYQEQLKKYCWIDVEVLTMVCRVYRGMLLLPKETDTNWQFNGIDPFSCLTASQIGLKVFLQGFKELPPIAAINIHYERRTSPEGLAWIEFMQAKHNLPLEGSQSLLNNMNCPYLFSHGVYVDATYYVTENGKLYCLVLLYLDPMKDESKAEAFLATNPECSTLIIYTNHTEPMSLLYRSRFIQPSIIQFPEFFYGGRCEVFCVEKLQIAPTEKIKYIDVCSLYPFVCAFKTLPTGIATIYTGGDIDPARMNPAHPQAFFGYVKCRVRPNPHDRLGILPTKDKVGRLIFSLEIKVGTWFTEELYLAMEQGYVIEEMYQVYHWDPEQRSDTLFREYVSYWLTIKQQSEGWKKLGLKTDATQAEKDVFVESLFQQNQGIGRIDPALVYVNPVMRAIAKLFLNSLWGKFVQKPRSNFSLLLTGPAQLMQLFNDENIDKDSLVFRELQAETLRVYGTKKPELVDTASTYNACIGAAVTAHARTILHRKILEVGVQNVLYCDTDSIIVTVPKEKEFPDKGLGQWVDEYPNVPITGFHALAPKSYSVYFEEKKTLLKAKGNTLTLPNQDLLTKTTMQGLVRDTKETVALDSFQIIHNNRNVSVDYGNPMSRYNKKRLHLQITKRELRDDMYTYPFGYL